MSDHVDLLDGLDFEIPASKETAQASGQFFGPYQFVQDVGEGGVAHVMRARHIHPRYADQAFAIKVLHKELCHDPQVVNLFRREAYVLSLLKHRNIVQTFEAGAQEGQLFISMEYISGRDVDNLLNRVINYQMAVPTFISMHIISEVLEALNYAHALCDSYGNPLNLIHRDVNPANVFLSYDGRVKLGDFGVASITAGRVEKKRELAGKVGYFSPEQLSGNPVDHRADLFAVGVMMFEMLCGARLFEADNAADAMRLNKRAKIPQPSKVNPNLHRGLEALMLRALQKRPQDRFSSAKEMLSALQPYVPPREGMDLAVSALMGHLFLGEYIEEVKLRQGLTGHGYDPSLATLVTVCTPNEQALTALVGLFKSRGIGAIRESSYDSLVANLATQRPHVIIVDVDHESLGDAAAFGARVRAAVPETALVGMSNALTPRCVGLSYAMGAQDVLFMPFSAERAVVAVQIAAQDNAWRMRHEVVTRMAEATRILLVSENATLVQSLLANLTPLGFTLVQAKNSEDALRLSQLNSFTAVVYEAVEASETDLSFARAYRCGPGINIVPILYLADGQAQARLARMPAIRTRVMARSTAAAILAAALEELRRDTRAGRAYVRYDTHLPGEIRYGGRVFACEVVNVSRGGVMLQCDHIPPVGTEVGVSVRFPSSSMPMSSVARVVRVALVKTDQHDTAQVGVEFVTFAGRSEADLIGYIRSLEQHPVTDSLLPPRRMTQPPS